MAYFDGIKEGNKVWSLEYGWGTCFEVDLGIGFKVRYDLIDEYRVFYNFEGKTHKELNQTLFWDEVKFKAPKRKYN